MISVCDGDFRFVISIEEEMNERNFKLPEMLEDEVDEEGNIETLVIGWDYDTVLVLLHSQLFVTRCMRVGIKTSARFGLGF